MSRSLKATLPVVRCAVYTRKSTEEGLQQEFNSLDAQREAGEAFIASQRAEGWACLPDRYDDPGFSGGTMDRPALKRLLADIEAGKIDCVVVYKVDRLSRSLPRRHSVLPPRRPSVPRPSPRNAPPPSSRHPPRPHSKHRSRPSKVKCRR